MQKSKTIFLIISLLNFIACGKKSEDEKSHFPPEKTNTQERGEAQYNPSLDMDFDGDLIPNMFDANPFVVDSPVESITFSIQSNQLEMNQIQFSATQINRTSVIEVIGSKFREDGLSYDFSIGLTSPIIKSNLSTDIELTHFLRASDEIKEVSFIIKDQYRKIISGKLKPNQVLTSKLGANSISNKKLFLDFEDMSFLRGDQLISYKTFLTSVKEKSYRISLINEQGELHTKQIAYKLNIDEGLEKMGYSQSEIDQIKDRNSELLINDLQTLPAKTGGWIPLNFKENPNPGDHIIFIYIFAEELRALKQPEILENFSEFSPEMTINVSDLKNIKFRIKGELTYILTIEEQKEGFYPETSGVGMASRLWSSCKYLLVTTRTEQHSINVFNFSNYLDFYLDGSNINHLVMHKNGYLTLNQVKGYQNLTIKLNNSFKRSSVYGVIKPQRGYCTNSMFETKSFDHPIKYESFYLNPIANLEFEIDTIKEPLLH